MRISQSLLLGAAAAAAPSILCTRPCAQENFLECTRVLRSSTSAPFESIVASALVPDLDGDGVAELLLGWSVPSRTGRLQLLDGRTGLELLRVEGAPGEELGRAVATLGDLDGDGRPDLLASALGIGAVRVYSSASGILLREATGPAAAFGRSVASAGDVDLDGVPDFAVGEVAHPLPDPEPHEVRGRVSIVSGADGHELRSLAGSGPDDRFGEKLAFVEDRRLAVFSLRAVTPGRGFGRVSVYNPVNGGERLVLTPPLGHSYDGMVALGNVRTGLVGPDSPGLLLSDSAVAQVFDARSGALVSQTVSRTGELFVGAVALDDVDGDRADDFVMSVIGQVTSTEGPNPWIGVYSGRSGTLLRTLTATSPFSSFNFVGAGPDVDGDGLGDPVASVIAGDFPADTAESVFVISSSVPVQVFGRAMLGSGGVMPQIDVGGCPRVRGSMRIETERVVGGAVGVLLLGAARADRSFRGGTLYPRGDVHLVHRAGGARGVIGAGDASLTLQLPIDVTLAGSSFYAQALYVDRGAPLGVSITHALRLTLY